MTGLAAPLPLNGRSLDGRALTYYRVFLRGENFLIEVDGKSTRMGFFTTRFVQANNRDGAELLAVDLIRNDKWLRGAVSNDPTDPPMIFAEEIEAIESPNPDVGPGFSFYPMDASDADGSDA